MRNAFTPLKDPVFLFFFGVFPIAGNLDGAAARGTDLATHL
jgi:hypothetical protein